MPISELSQNITNDILRLIHQNSGKVGRYRSFSLEYTEPLLFDLTVTIKVADQIVTSRDQYFKNLPSETMRFERFGFAVDGDSFGGDQTDPAEISIVVAVHPSQIKSTKLEARILDVVRHELEHLLQRGDNFSPEHRVKISRPATREAAKSNYSYFILSDEIPAQVRGLAEEARHTGETVKQCAIDYLTPFLELGFITQPELTKVLTVWEKWATANNIKFT